MKKKTVKKKLKDLHEGDELLKYGMVLGFGGIVYAGARVLQDHGPFFVGRGLRAIRDEIMDREAKALADMIKMRQGLGGEGESVIWYNDSTGILMGDHSYRQDEVVDADNLKTDRPTTPVAQEGY
jgi:hypothetical protein